MSCVGLWVASGNYMCQWQLTHAEVDVTDENEQDNFLPDTDDEAEDNTTTSTTQSTGGGVMVEDSDGDDAEDGNNDDDQESDDGTKTPSPAPEPVEPPKVKRKIVRKKKTAAS